MPAEIAINGSAQCYYGTSIDGVTWTYFSGGTATGFLWKPVAQASEAAAQAAAVTITTGTWRVELPAPRRARFIRLFHRNPSAGYSLREFFPATLVRATNIESESLTTVHIGANFVLADSAAIGALDGYLVTAATFRTNATPTRIEINDTDFRVINAGVTRVRIDTDGLKTYDGAGNVQVQATTLTDGALLAGAGNVILDDAGQTLLAPEAASWLEAAATNIKIRRASGLALMGAIGGRFYSDVGLVQVVYGAIAITPGGEAQHEFATTNGAGVRKVVVIANGGLEGSGDFSFGNAFVNGGLRVGSGSAPAAGSAAIAGNLNTSGNAMVGSNGAAASRLHVVGSQVRLDFSTTSTDRGILMLSNSGFPEIRAGQVGNYSTAEPLILQDHGGLLSVGGALQLREITAPGAGTANTGRLFLDDNGSGKSRMRIQWADGTITTLATQP